MIKIEIDLEDAPSSVKRKPNELIGDLNMTMYGNCDVVANELSIVLYQIFTENPEIVTKALNYCSQRINKHIKEDE